MWLVCRQEPTTLKLPSKLVVFQEAVKSLLMSSFSFSKSPLLDKEVSNILNTGLTTYLPLSTVCLEHSNASLAFLLAHSTVVRMYMSQVTDCFIGFIGFWFLVYSFCFLAFGF